MEFWVAVSAFFTLWGMLYAGRRIYIRQRRKRVRSRPFPASWEALLETKVALYGQLPRSLKEKLRRKILLFIDEKNFEGCGGLRITDEIRLTIAAQACLLLLNRPEEELYPNLRSILVYPEPYVAPDYIPLDDNIYMETRSVQSGESWQEGMVVLAWRDVRKESRSLRHGYNVVLHEFAHQIDQESGWADGMPRLGNRASYDAWQTVFHREFLRLRNGSSGRDDIPLDEYGAVDPAEFFAVATETFFQIPRHMREKVPELYDQLRHYYDVDPAEWKEF